MGRAMPKKGPRNGEARQALAVAAPSDPAQAAEAIDLKSPDLYINRELSLLAFQRRVLEEAEDESNPLLERVKFAGIVGSNLDEFFMVRVAGLVEQLESGVLESGPDGMSPLAQLVAIRREVRQLLADVHTCVTLELVPALASKGIHVVELSTLNARAHTVAKRYFERTI